MNTLKGPLEKIRANLGHLRNIFSTITAGARAVRLQLGFPRCNNRGSGFSAGGDGDHAFGALRAPVCRGVGASTAPGDGAWGSPGTACGSLTCLCRDLRDLIPMAEAGAPHGIKGSGLALGSKRRAKGVDLAPVPCPSRNTGHPEARLWLLRIPCDVAAGRPLWPQGKKDWAAWPRSPSRKQRRCRCQFRAERKSH